MDTKGLVKYINKIWVNIAKSELNLRYRYCLNLIGELRKEKEFRQQCCRNSTKVGEWKRKSWREKEEEFRQRCYRNSSVQIPAQSCVKKQLRQYHCRNREKKKKIFFLVIVAMALPKRGKKLNGIMAMSLPKMGGKKNCCQNLGRNFKKSVTFTIFL